MIRDTFWITNPSILLCKERFLEFWPSVDMNQVEKINATTRFVLYSTILVFAFTQRASVVAAGLAIILAIGIVGKYDTNKEAFQDMEGPFVKAGSFVNDRGETCRRPTDDNPFANPMPGDPMDSPPACLYDEVKDDIKQKFERGLYKNMNDIFDTENSRRQFYTIPNTKFPNEQTKFAKYLFSQGPNCRSNPTSCTGYDYGAKSDVSPLDPEYVL